MIPIILLQTCDVDVYEPMFQQTFKTVREYKKRIKCECRAFLGIYRGYHPWHAAFNRIFMISELLEQNYKGWAIYLDTDAYVVDLEFDVRKYLQDKAQYWAIMTPGEGKGPWDVNDGVMLINLEHHLTQVIVKKWKATLMGFSDGQMLAAKNFETDGVCGDQLMLQNVLKEDANYSETLLKEKHTFINSPYANFIRQLLRADEPDLATRIARITGEVQTVVAKAAI